MFETRVIKIFVAATNFYPLVVCIRLHQQRISLKINGGKKRENYKNRKIKYWKLKIKKKILHAELKWEKWHDDQQYFSIVDLIVKFSIEMVFFSTLMMFNFFLFNDTQIHNVQNAKFSFIIEHWIFYFVVDAAANVDNASKCWSEETLCFVVSLKSSNILNRSLFASLM